MDKQIDRQTNRDRQIDRSRKSEKELRSKPIEEKYIVCEKFKEWVPTEEETERCRKYGEIEIVKRYKRKLIFYSFLKILKTYEACCQYVTYIITIHYSSGSKGIRRSEGRNIQHAEVK